jgi:hypothetical protein
MLATPRGWNKWKGQGFFVPDSVERLQELSNSRVRRTPEGWQELEEVRAAAANDVSSWAVEVEADLVMAPRLVSLEPGKSHLPRTNTIEPLRQSSIASFHDYSGSRLGSNRLQVTPVRQVP